MTQHRKQRDRERIEAWKKHTSTITSRSLALCIYEMSTFVSVMILCIQKRKKEICCSSSWTQLHVCVSFFLLQEVSYQKSQHTLALFSQTASSSCFEMKCQSLHTHTHSVHIQAHVLKIPEKHNLRTSDYR